MSRALAAASVWLLCAATSAVEAHSGPPFPIVSDQVAGAYRVSIWTDPDTTDDGAAGGQFWVRMENARTGAPLPPQTRAAVAIRPVAGDGASTQAAAPVRGDVTNQFAALVMDREGTFAVRVTIDGPLGAAAVDAQVEATYDLRPPPYLLALYLAPFVLAGLLWGRLLLRRRAADPSPVDS